jgi:hypothetical protein
MQTIFAPAMVIRSSAEDIRQHLVEGQRLIGSGQLRSAAVLLWSAFEAAVRLSLTELGRQTGDLIGISDSPYGLCVQAVAYGVIDPEDRDVLMRFVPLLNAAEHVGVETTDAGLLQEVSRFTERALDEMERQ